MKSHITSVKILFGVLSVLLFNACGTASTPVPTSAPTGTPAATRAAANNEILVVIGEFPPYTSESLPGQGLITEVVKAAFAETGYSVRVEFYPWKRCEELVTSGEAWGTFPYILTEERRANYSISDVLYIGRDMWFSHGDKMAGVEYEKLSDLRPYRVGGSLGFTYLKPLEEAGLTVDTANDDLASLNKLHADRVDLVPFSEYTGWQLIRSNFPNEVGSFHMLKTPLLVNDNVVIASKSYPNSAAILKAFNEGLAHIQENGAVKALFDRYDVPYVPSATTPSSN